MKVHLNKRHKPPSHEASVVKGRKGATVQRHNKI